MKDIIYQSGKKEKFYEKRIVFQAKKKYNRTIIRKRGRGQWQLKLY